MDNLKNVLLSPQSLRIHCGSEGNGKIIDWPLSLQPRMGTDMKCSQRYQHFILLQLPCGPKWGFSAPQQSSLDVHVSPRSCAWYPISTIVDQHPNLFSQGRIKQACLLTINACPVICWPFSLVYWELQSYHWVLTGYSWDAGPDMLDDTLETQPSGVASQSSEPSYCGHCGQGRKKASGLRESLGLGETTCIILGCTVYFRI